MASVVGKEKSCCLAVVDHHLKCQTDKWLSELYDDFFAFLTKG